MRGRLLDRSSPYHFQAGALHSVPWRPQGQLVVKRLNVNLLKNPQTAQELQSALDGKLSSAPSSEDGVGEQWKSFRDTPHSTTFEILGPASRNHQDWFDDNDTEIWDMLEEKRHLLRAYQNDPSCAAKKAAFSNMRSKVQTKLRAMLDSWLSSKADEIQAYADRHDTKRFYDALRAVYGPPSSVSSPLLIADGSILLTEKQLILER